MNKNLAIKLLKVFDTPNAVNTIVEYADEEINKYFKSLQSASDPVEIYRLQGSIRALNTLKLIRQSAEDVVK